MADYKQLIIDAVKRHNLPPVWAEIGPRQMMAESGGNPTAVSPAGAQGLMQFMPKTAKGYGLQNPNDPAQAVDAWARMTGDLIKQTGGNPAHVLAAYNWGIGNLSKQGMDKAPKETRDYIAKIMGSVPLGGTRVAEAPKPYSPAVQSAGAQDVQQALSQANNPVQGDPLGGQPQQMAMSPVYSPEMPLQTDSPEIDWQARA